MCSTRNIAKILGKAAVNGVIYSAFGAIDGAVGAAVMRRAHHTSYDVLESVRVGAAGAAVIGGAAGFAKELIHVLDKEFHFLPRSDEARNKDHFDNTIETAIGELIIGLATMAASGALGHEMLKSITQMSLAMCAFSLFVGSATIAGAFAALFCCCAACCCCLAGTKKGLEVANGSGPRASFEMPSFADFRKTSIHDVGTMGDMFRKVSVQSRGDVEAPKEAPPTTPGGP